MKKKIILLSLLISMCSVVMAQDKFETTISADMVSQYIWRGQECGSVSLQPTLDVSYKGLSLSAWGSVGLVDFFDTKELDLTLSYTLGNLYLGVTDYWFDEGSDPYGRYFKYKSHETNHVFEASVGYDFGFLYLQWNTNFAGNDAVNDEGDILYSSYFEIDVPFRLASCDWVGSIGAVPFATDYYATTDFAVTHVALKTEKSIKVTDSFSIPLFAQLIANPCSQKAYFVFGLTLRP